MTNKLSLLFLLSAFLFPSPLFAAFAEVASQRNTVAAGSSADSQALAYPNNVAKGDTLCNGGALYDAGGAPASVTVTDSVGTTYDIIINQPASTISIYSACGIAPVDGANTVTVNPAGGAAYIAFAITAFTGGKAGDLADVNGGWTFGDSTNAAHDITSTVSDALLLGVVSQGSATTSISPGGSYTEIGENEDNTCCVAFNFVFRIISGAPSTLTIDWTFGATSPWYVQTRSLKPETAAAAVVRRRTVIVQ